MTLHELLYMVEDLLNLFLSGFICMSAYYSLNGKQMNVSLATIWSLFISFLIKSGYTVVHTYMLRDLVVDDSVKIIVYAATGGILALLCTWLKGSWPMRKLLGRINYKSVNDDIFDEIISYNEPPEMQIYIKSSDVYYIGRFCGREEKGLDSWIVLIDYHSIHEETGEEISRSDSERRRSTVAINLSNVERIELFYKAGSKLWKKLGGERK